MKVLSFHESQVQLREMQNDESLSQDQRAALGWAIYGLGLLQHSECGIADVGVPHGDAINIRSDLRRMGGDQF